MRKVCYHGRLVTMETCIVLFADVKRAVAEGC